MTSRTSTREFSDFLFPFVDDEAYLVVPKSTILTDGRIRLVLTHDVVLGQPHEFEKAIILATGEWLELNTSDEPIKKGQRRTYSHQIRHQNQQQTSLYPILRNAALAQY